MFKDAQGGHGPGRGCLQRGLEGVLSLRATVRTLVVSEGGRHVGVKDIYDGFLLRAGRWGSKSRKAGIASLQNARGPSSEELQGHP